jgi:hypothetical protein
MFGQIGGRIGDMDPGRRAGDADKAVAGGRKEGFDIFRHFPAISANDRRQYSVFSRKIGDPMRHFHKNRANLVNFVTLAAFSVK